MVIIFLIELLDKAVNVSLIGNDENLYIARDKLQSLERAFKQASASHNAKELGFQMFLTSLTIMHEAAHYGYYKKQGKEESIRLEKRDKVGALFEAKAFKRFSYTTKGGAAMDEDSMRSYLQLNRGSTGMIGITLAPNFGLYDFNKFFLKEAPAPSEALPRNLDPTIH